MQRYDLSRPDHRPASAQGNWAAQHIHSHLLSKAATALAAVVCLCLSPVSLVHAADHPGSDLLVTPDLIAGIAKTPYSVAAAQPTSGDQAGRDWSIEFLPYVWLQNVSGKVRSGATTVDLTGTFIDYYRLSDEVGFGFAKLEARYRRFGIYLDYAYGFNGIDFSVGPVQVGPVTVPNITGNLSASQTFLDAVAFYRIFDGRHDTLPGSGAHPVRVEGLTVDVLGGVRYSRQGYELSLSANGPLVIQIGPIEITRTVADQDLNQVSELFDPIFGARFRYQFDPRWSAMLRGDIGGFGVGSEFTWNVVATVNYRFTVWGLAAEAVVGYRGLYQHTISRSATSKVVSRLTYHGPILGLHIRF